MNFTKSAPQQSQEFNSKILAWPRAGDREEGNEDEWGRGRSTSVSKQRNVGIF